MHGFREGAATARDRGVASSRARSGGRPAAPHGGDHSKPPVEFPVLDVIYLVTTLALFALVGLIAKGVEKLGPPARGAAAREATGGEERR